MEDLDYVADGQLYEGRLLAVENGAIRPGLLLVPNWLGVTGDAVRRAEVFVELGYTVLVVDLYGKGVRPSSISEAAEQADIVRTDPAKTRAVMAAAAAALRQSGCCADVALSAVGFCLGGGAVLEAARSGADLAAAVSIHGDLATHLPASPGVKMPSILILHGSEDPVVPRADRETLEAEMRSAGCDWHMLTFGGRVHAFTDPDVDMLPVARYDDFADRWSYDLTHRFIQDCLQRCERRAA